jgi:hypothetical protein
MKNIYNPTRVESGSAGAILNLETGQGKTFLAAYLISVFKKRTCIILHSTSMIEQWIKVIVACYPTATIGIYYGKKKTIGDIQILIIDSAISDVFRFGSEKKGTYKEIPALEFYNQYGFMIYDECQEYCNNNDGKVFKYAQAPYMLGLSASPDENANKWDRIAWWEIGPVLRADLIPGYQASDCSFTGVVHRLMYYGSPEYTRVIKNEKTDMTSSAETINMICNDEIRNKLVIMCILDAMKLQLYTYVFADRREYLEELRVELKEALEQKRDKGNADGKEKEKKGDREQNINTDYCIVTSDEEFIRLVGGSKANDLETAEIKSKIIFTTYQYGATGRSIIKMNALILATPRKSKIKQTIGRILRLGSDTSIKRHIYDIVDMKLKLKNQWNVRNKFYATKGFDIEEQKYTQMFNTWKLINESDKEEDNEDTGDKEENDNEDKGENKEDKIKKDDKIKKEDAKKNDNKNIKVKVIKKKEDTGDKEVKKEDKEVKKEDRKDKGEKIKVIKKKEDIKKKDTKDDKNIKVKVIKKKDTKDDKIIKKEDIKKKDTKDDTGDKEVKKEKKGDKIKVKKEDKIKIKVKVIKKKVKDIPLDYSKLSINIFNKMNEKDE